MIGLLAALISGLIGNIPLILKFFEKKADIAREIDLTKLQGEFKLKGDTINADKERDVAEVNDRISARANDNSIHYSEFWEGVRSSIRPTVTYLFLGIWLAVKLAVFVEVYWFARVGLVDSIKLVLWDVQTAALFEMIVGFWFGARMVRKP